MGRRIGDIFEINFVTFFELERRFFLRSVHKHLSFVDVFDDL